jgi:hypothetical protein
MVKLWSPVCLLLWLTAAGAVYAVAVTEEYRANQPMAAGMMVSAFPDEEGSVEAAHTANAGRVFGVIVAARDSNIALGGEGGSIVQVATSGTVEVLVSDMNGTIAKGDLLSVSPLAGLAAKAIEEPSAVGTALEDFKGEPEESIGTAQVSAKNGRQTTVRIGRIDVQFEVSANPAAGDLIGRLPRILQGLGSTVANKAVSPLRIVVALIILIITLTLSSVLMLGAIRSALTAIGRNPLSRGAVYRGMLQVFGLVGLVIAGGLGTIYLILRL